MSKVIKILGKFVATIILLLIILPLFAALLLTIPRVQKFAIDFTTGIVSDVLQSRVEIGHIDLWPIYSVSVKDFYVEDHQKDTLLYVEHLSTRITSFGAQRLHFGKANVTGAKFNLIEGADSILNIKSVLEPIMPENPKGTFEVRFSSIDMTHSRFSFQKLDKRKPDKGMDYYDICFDDMSAKIEDLHVLGAVVNAKILSLSAKEKGGGVLDNASMGLYVNSGEVILSNMIVEFGTSIAEIDFLRLNAEEWKDYSNFIDSVDIEAQLFAKDISTNDIAPFAPEIGEVSIVGRDAQVSLSGRVSNLDITVDDIKFANSSRLSGDVAIMGLPDAKNSYYNINIASMSSNVEDINSTLEGVGTSSLQGEAKSIVERMGTVNLTGTVQGTLDSLNMSGKLSSITGDVDFNISIFERMNSRIMGGYIESGYIDLGKMLNVDKLGSASLTSYISIANIGQIESQSITIDGHIAQLNYNSYPYSNISYSTTIRNNRYSAYINSLDANAFFTLDGDISLDRQDEEGYTPIDSYSLELDIRECNLARLGFNKRDSVSIFSGLITSSLTGSSLDELEGSVYISDASYIFNQDTISTETISISSSANSVDREVIINSEFISAEYTSLGSHSNIIAYLQGALYNYLPVIYPPSYSPPSTKSEYSQLSTLNISLLNGEKLFHAIDSRLSIADGSWLWLSFDPSMESINLKMHSSFIEHGSLLAIGLDIDSSNTQNTIGINGYAKQLYMGMTIFEELSTKVTAHDDSIYLKLNYSDDKSNEIGVIDISSEISREGDGSLGFNFNISPSFITYDNEKWDISTQELSIESGVINIDNFTIRNAEQYLSISGVASNSIEDIISVDLQNFDLGILTQFTESIGYQIEGVTSGFASINSALKDSRIEASIDIDSVALNSIPSPPLRLTARWDSERNRAGVSVYKRENINESSEDKNIIIDTLVRGYYRPSDAAYFALIDIDSINIGVINPLLEGVLSSNEGYASTSLELRGKRQEISLSGEIVVENMSTLVDFSNVQYNVPKAVINVNNSRFETRRVPVYDTMGGEALMTLAFDISQLGNVNYNVRIVPENLMVLDLSEEQSELFYGRVFASGSAQISGDKAGVNMTIAAKTEDNSEFYMPLSSKSNASSAEFIKFVEPPKQVDSLSYILSRRAAFESKLRDGSSGGAGISISMALEVTPGAEVQLVIDPTVGDIIKARGEGRLNLEINPKTNLFEMYGDYNITEGNYLFTLQNIVNKRFIINSGSSIQWSGDPLDATLNITALYELKTSLQPLLGDSSSDESWRSVPVECIIHLKDRLMSPTVSFEIELPDSDAEQQTMVANILNDQETISRQFFYLMIANSFISESSSSSIASIGSTSTAATTGFELLTNQLSNWLSSSDYSIILRYRPDSELTGDEVDIGFSKGWIDNRLIIEVEGNYVSDYEGSINEVSNIMGEAYITWLIDKEGALRIRAFSQTIDRFDENQGLQETGVGIYYSENFNNISDLKKRVAERFNSLTRRRKKAKSKDSSQSTQTQE